jgi:hypothetical protein
VAGTSSIGVIGMISRVKDGITDDPLTSKDVFNLDPRCSTSIVGGQRRVVDRGGSAVIDAGRRDGSFVIGRSIDVHKLRDRPRPDPHNRSQVISLVTRDQVQPGHISRVALC